MKKKNRIHKISKEADTFRVSKYFNLTVEKGRKRRNRIEKKVFKKVRKNEKISKKFILQNQPYEHKGSNSKKNGRQSGQIYG